MSKPRRSTAPTTDPTTIPAIAPPDNPFFDVEAAGVLVLDEVDPDVDVPVDVGSRVEKLTKPVMVGNIRPAHLVCASEL